MLGSTPENQRILSNLCVGIEANADASKILKAIIQGDGSSLPLSVTMLENQRKR